VKNPKNLESVKVGGLVDITYAQALAVALDKTVNATLTSITGLPRRVT
jgi:hypothetical protein